eukprot:PhF_6_TR4485/c0_g1_i1/m.6173
MDDAVEAFAANHAVLSRIGTESVFDILRRPPQMSRSSSCPSKRSPDSMSFKSIAVPGGFRKNYVEQKQRVLAQVCLDDLARKLRIPVESLIKGLQKGPPENFSNSCEPTVVLRDHRDHIPTRTGSEYSPQSSTTRSSRPGPPPRMGERNSSSLHLLTVEDDSPASVSSATSRLLPSAVPDSYNATHTVFALPLNESNDGNSIDDFNIIVSPPAGRSKNMAVFVRDDTTTSVAVFPTGNISPPRKKVTFGVDLVTSVTMIEDRREDGSLNETGDMQMKITFAMPVIAWTALVLATLSITAFVVFVNLIEVDKDIATTSRVGMAASVAQCTFVIILLICAILKAAKQMQGSRLPLDIGGPLRNLTAVCIGVTGIILLNTLAATRVTVLQNGLTWALPPLYMVGYRAAIENTKPIKSDVLALMSVLFGAFMLAMSEPGGIMSTGVDVLGLVESILSSMCITLVANILKEVRCHFTVSRIIIVVSFFAMILLTAASFIMSGVTATQIFLWYDKEHVWGAAVAIGGYTVCMCVAATFLDTFSIVCGTACCAALCRFAPPSNLSQWVSSITGDSEFHICTGIIGCVFVLLGVFVGTKYSSKERSKVYVRIQPKTGFLKNTVEAVLGPAPAKQGDGAAPFAQNINRSFDLRRQEPKKPVFRLRTLGS